MNRAQALAKLKKLFPRQNVGLQFNKYAPKDEDARAAQQAARKAAEERAKLAGAALEFRRAELLAADAEYRRLKEEHAQARKHAESLPHGFTLPYDVGYTVAGLFFHVSGSGYTLREAIENAEKKK